MVNAEQKNLERVLVLLRKLRNYEPRSLDKYDLIADLEEMSNKIDEILNLLEEENHG